MLITFLRAMIVMGTFKKLISVQLLINMPFFVLASGLDFIRLRPHAADPVRLADKYKDISLTNCLVQCQMDKCCKAISYNERFRYCELNRKSGLYTVVDSSAVHGWKIFNAINQTADSSNKKNWSDAADACEVEGTGLVRIENVAENDYLMATVEELNGGLLDGMIYTAGTDIETEGSWVWSRHSDVADGEALEYTNWNNGEPNNVGGSEDCLIIWPESRSWYDVPCSLLMYYICENPNPFL